MLTCIMNNIGEKIQFYRKELVCIRIGFSLGVSCTPLVKFSVEVVCASLDVPTFQQTTCGGVWVAVQHL